MNFSPLLLSYLRKQESATIPGFGIFYLKNINAVLDQEGKSILPPTTEINFKTENATDHDDFVEFISVERKISFIEAQIELKKLTNYWNATLYKDHEISIQGLGTFFLEENKIHFKGNRIENLSTDFYGLEEIQFDKIKAPKNTRSYQFNKSAVWLLFLIIPLLGLTYFGVTQPELIFGKKSFKDEAPKKKAVPVKIESLKVDSLKAVQYLADSLQNDSLQKSLLPIKAPVKKWSSKNYSKSKWKNPKKRQNP